LSQAGTYNGGGIFPPGSVVETLTGNSGGAVGPNVGNNIFVVGDGMTVDVVGNPGTNTLTISAMGSVALQFDADSGSANPSGGIIHMTGGTNINTVAAGSVVTYNLDDAIVVATSAQIANLLLAANTISSVNSNGNIVLSPNGSGTVNIAYATLNAVAVYGASGALSQVGPLTNGQIIIGSSGVAPVAGTITSNGGTITITTGPGAINIETSGISSFSYKNVNSSPYTVLTTDEYISVDCSGGPITIKLHNAATTGQSFTIKDRTGNASTNNITVTTVGGVVNIDGSTSFVLNTNYESINVLGNSTSYEVW